MSTERDLIGSIVAENPIIGSVMDQYALAQEAYQGALKAMGLIPDVASRVGNSADFFFTSPEHDPYVIDVHAAPDAQI